MQICVQQLDAPAHSCIALLSTLFSRQPLHQHWQCHLWELDNLLGKVDGLPEGGASTAHPVGQAPLEGFPGREVVGREVMEGLLGVEKAAGEDEVHGPGETWGQ